MVSEQEFFDRLKSAGNLVLGSAPFADKITFFKEVLATPEPDPHCNDAQNEAHKRVMDAWLADFQKQVDYTGAKLVFHDIPQSHMFGGAGGWLIRTRLYDFPVNVNLQDTSLFDACEVGLELKLAEFNGFLRLRQQYGEPFLDYVCVTRDFLDSGDLISKVAKIPITAVSVVEPVEEKDKRDYQRRLDGWCTGQAVEPEEEPFYFEPKSLGLSDFQFKPGSKVVVPYRQIVTAYLEQFRSDFYERFDKQDVPELDFPFIDFVGDDDTREVIQERFRRKVQGIYRRSIDIRNFHIQRLIELATERFNPLEGSFYVLLSQPHSQNHSVHFNHYRADEMDRSLRHKSLFPKTYVLKIGPGKEGDERDYSIQARIDSFGDYCVWMRGDKCLDKTLDHLQSRGL
ncbi:MAG: hypothetical protein PHF67_03360 [Candidatus Nanoarchaeia archaeon]|nr:hypothetical protein [Candidatus Nanoarchaeia archaeon]